MYKKAIAIMSVLAIVFLCPFSTFAAQPNGVISRYLRTGTLISIDGYQHINYAINLTVFPVTHGETGAMTNTVTAQYEYTEQVLGYITILNNNATDIKFTGNTYDRIIRFNIQPENPSVSIGTTPTNYYWRCTNIEYLGGQLKPTSLMANGGGTVQFENTNLESDGSPSSIIIPAYSSVCCYFMMTYSTLIPQGTFSNYVSFSDNTVYERGDTRSGIFGDYHENYISYIPDIYSELVSIYTSNQNQLSVLQQILASYNANVPIASDATQDNNSSQTTSDAQHQLEQGYFNNTNSAISNSGLNTYNFDNDQINGIGRISNDFTYLFNGLGSWNKVYIFALTLTLAMAIIRYIKPRRSSS